METRKHLFETKWKQYLSEQNQKPDDTLGTIPDQAKVAVVKAALELYKAGKKNDLNQYLEIDLKNFLPAGDSPAKYNIDERPDLAAAVYDVYAGQNPLFLYIDNKYKK